MGLKEFVFVEGHLVHHKAYTKLNIKFNIKII
jgi:hypothetical protein